MDEPLTWTCHFCGEERPDARVSVAKADVTPPGHGWPPWTIGHNRRYCNDRKECVQRAEMWRQEAERKAQTSKSLIEQISAE